MTAALLQAMYAPLDYIHGARVDFALPAADSSETFTPGLRQALNHALIKRLALPVRVDFDLTPADFSAQLIDNWQHLRQVAHLVGCKLARGTLAQHRYFGLLPDATRRFVALPIECPVIPLSAPLQPEQLELHGARYLLALCEQLPAALARRLPLVFAPGVADGVWQGHINRSLLTFAIDYAKTTPN